MDRRTIKGSVIIFGILDWHERYQRPQEIALNLSLLGWKVAYISPHLGQDHFSGYSILENVNENLVIVRLSVLSPAPNPYFEAPNRQQEISFSLNLNLFCAENNFIGAPYVMQLPFWWHFLKNESNHIIYDCMDFHPGFDDHSNVRLIENQALNGIDQLITSSNFLKMLYAENSPTLIRNGCTPDQFSVNQSNTRSGLLNIGYFGVIDKWFDSDLITKISERFKNLRIHLIGYCSEKNREILSKLSNVVLYGEVPHSELDRLADKFDLSIIPFLITDLTRATDPVKIYEYAAKGLFTISTNLPELEFVPDYVVYRSQDHEDFLMKIEQFFSSPGDIRKDTLVRRSWAEKNSWHNRALEFEKIFTGINQSHMILIISFNNFSYISNLITSIINYSRKNLEIVIVDNSDDPDEFEKVKKLAFLNNITYISLKKNLGFPAAVNVGVDYFTISRYKLLTVLNDDVLFDMDYVSSIERHFINDPTLGIVGPLTNSIGNEAKVNYLFSGNGNKKVFLNTLLGLNRAKLTYVNNLAFFAVTISNDVVKTVGKLDEDFGLGYFEDDDYCVRAKAFNFKIAIALDTYVTHKHSKSFNKLGNDKINNLMRINKSKFESKHGSWNSHKYKLNQLTVNSIVDILSN